MLKGKTCEPNFLALEMLVEKELGIEVYSTKEVCDGYLMKTNKGKLHIAVEETLYEIKVIDYIFE